MENSGCDRYILRGHAAVPCPDLHEWARWVEDSGEQRAVARTYLGDGALRVCTSFLALDYSPDPAGPPLLFETMIYDERRDEWWDNQWRCSTWEQAEEQHRTVVAQVGGALPTLEDQIGEPR